MTTELRLPHIGESIAKATVLSVRVAPGQSVAVGDTIVEIETDKASLDVPADAAGVVREVRVHEGDEIAPGDVLVVVDEAALGERLGGETLLDKAAPGKEPAGEATGSPEEALGPQHIPSTPSISSIPSIPPTPAPAPSAAPLARRLARELGIDIAQVAASGAGGRVATDDVTAHARRLLAGQANATSLPGFTRLPNAVPLPHATPQPEVTPFANAAPLPDPALFGPVRRVPFTRVRATIVRRLGPACHATPLAHHFDEADVTALEAARRAHNAVLGEGVAPATGAASITITAIVLKQTALLLCAYPDLNASLDVARGEIVYHDYCHIGVAVDTARGLVVPVIRDADRKPLADLAAELRGLAFAARQGKPFVLPPPGTAAGAPHPRPAGLLPDELHGSTFTISNLGRIGGTQFAPILNPPNVAILGVSRIQKRVALDADGRPVERLVLPLVLGYDHRLIDGAQAARFLKDLAGRLAETDALARA